MFNEFSMTAIPLEDFKSVYYTYTKYILARSNIKDSQLKT